MGKGMLAKHSSRSSNRRGSAVIRTCTNSPSRPDSKGCPCRVVGQALIDSSMAIGQKRKNPGLGSRRVKKFSETDSPLAFFYVVAISLNLGEPSSKSVHVYALRIALPPF